MRRPGASRAFAALAVAAVVNAPVALAAQDSTVRAAQPVPADATQPAARRTPWAAGEFLEYQLKFGFISAGSGRMQVLGRDTVRGRDTWRLMFDFSGGFGAFRVKDSFESWLTSDTHNSIRFEQRISEPGYKRTRVYEIFPERSVFKLNDEDEKPSVPNPLDDAAFFYFIRTIPLEVGKSYDFDRYFDPKSNPVTIRVLRKETVSVPAGKFEAIVIQPMIKTKGIFSEGGHAELWLTDDDRRILVQMKSKLPFGSLNLYLRKVVLPPLAGEPAGATPP